MRRRTDRVLYIMLILMGLITVLAMMFAGVLGIMYVKEKDKNQEAAVKQAQLEEEVVAAFAGITMPSMMKKCSSWWMPKK